MAVFPKKDFFLRHPVAGTSDLLLINHSLQALLTLLCSLLLTVMAVPAMDRPAKQADYAKLSHPANINTVYAKVTVEKAVPINSNSNRYY